MTTKVRCLECEEAGHGAADCPRLKAQREAHWRELIKPLVLQMHAEKYNTVTIKKDGGHVQLFVE